jgi:hypothetical protein
MWLKNSLLISILLLSAGFLILSCSKKAKDGLIIITVVKGNDCEPNFVTGESWRYIPQSRLIAIDPENSAQTPVILSEAFYSASSPEVSYDGKKIIFSAQKSKNDTWQIWEMNLGNKKCKQVTEAAENSVDPAYLPGERIVFSRFLKNDSLKAGHTLFTVNTDGTNIRRITFNPHTYFASSVLKDGRLIAISRQLYPVQGKSSIMVLRPDGTKSELFYQGEVGTTIFSKGWETENGNFVFIENENNQNGRGSVVSIKYNRPLHSRINLSSSITGYFNSVALFKQGKLLVSYKSDNDRYSLYEFDPEKRVIGNLVYKSTDFDVIDAVYVRIHNKPKKLPSEVDPTVKTGLLLCQNINLTGMQSPEGEFLNQLACRIEINGVDTSLGIVDVEEDGSFYLKVEADKPFTIKTLDKEGKVINGPGSWIWIRPNERRGCIGCHEDNEMVPANRFSLAVKSKPVSVPVNINVKNEKEVELE